MCDSENLKFIKEQEASTLLSSLGINLGINKKLADKFLYQVLFCFKGIQHVNTTYKMNEIVNKFLLSGNTFLTEMHLRQPGFTYISCGPFTKNKERIQKLKKKQEIRDIFIKMN